MTLFDLLHSSAVTSEFADAIREFASTGRSNERVEFNPGSPPVKVERTLVKMLVSFPDLAIERIRIVGRSGCEYFRGELVVHADGEEHLVAFDWDCRWKAQQLGWTDYFGFPDQIRAAREHGYDCFRGWDLRPPSIAIPA